MKGKTVFPELVLSNKILNLNIFAANPRTLGVQLPWQYEQCRGQTSRQGFVRGVVGGFVGRFVTWFVGGLV